MILPCVFLLLILSIDRYYNWVIPPILLATLYHPKLFLFISHFVTISVSGHSVICSSSLYHLSHQQGFSPNSSQSSPQSHEALDFVTGLLNSQGKSHCQLWWMISVTFCIWVCPTDDWHRDPGGISLDIVGQGPQFVWKRPLEPSKAFPWNTTLNQLVRLYGPTKAWKLHWKPHFLEPMSVLNRVPTQPQLCHWHTHTHTQLKPLWVAASTVTKFVVLPMQDHSMHLKVWHDTHSILNVSEYNQIMAAIHKNPAILGQPCQLV